MASTVTPGSTDPSVAVTFPLTAPVCWATAVRGKQRDERDEHAQ